MKVKRIDPVGCGCTDCLVGDSVPLQDATNKQLLKMIRGKVVNATGFDDGEFVVNVLLPDEAL